MCSIHDMILSLSLSLSISLSFFYLNMCFYKKLQYIPKGALPCATYSKGIRYLYIICL